MRTCAVIPSHNHHTAVPGILEVLRRAGLDVFIVDDGSRNETRESLRALHDPAQGVRVLRHDVNRGKGVAVCRALCAAFDAGYSHAVQVDADGQHDLEALPRLLAAAAAHPEALIAGVAVFDGSVPLARRIGRWITHVWVWIETLSMRVRDSMCGFRVYPLAPAAALMAEERIGERMDFDTEMLVRLFWRGVPVVSVPVRVAYPPGNVSNFDPLADNWRISKMHARLFFGMLMQLPRILRNRPPRIGLAPHWAQLSERGAVYGLRLGIVALRLVGRRGCLALLSPVVLYFYLNGAEQRRASRDFLRRAFAARGEPREPGLRDGMRHFTSFARRGIDSFAAWAGVLPPDSLEWATPDMRDRLLRDPRGALFIVDHIGNADISRALLDEKTRSRLTVLVHTRHAENFNGALRHINPASVVHTVQVTEIGPETAMTLEQCVTRGDWVVIAGDRTPVSGSAHVSPVNFLGAPAPFAHGPFVLAALLGCPVWTLRCLRRGRKYRVHAELFAERILLSRQQRSAALASHVERYARNLEAYALKDPYQWYNFFDFWAR